MASVLSLLVASSAGAGAALSRSRAGAVRLPPLPSLRSALQPAPTLGGQPPVSGPLRAPGGAYLMDGAGRVILLHGVDAVYKHPPYVLYPDPGKPWNLGAADASLMARLGFNVVRLGILWAGLEPGTAPANDPAICRYGAPQDPHQFNQGVLDAYLAKVASTVALLGKYHIYTILDMHQDVYNQLFDGEGAPNWAVCTHGIAPRDPPGRWSAEYGTAAAGAAFQSFWRNDVVGNLQGEYDRVWTAVAAYFSNDPWVLGYDPFNEPFSTSLVRVGGEAFDGQLECFYTGRTLISAPAHGAPAIRCPAHDPAVGVIPDIESVAPRQLVFYEPDIYASRGLPNFVGPMPFHRLVFNVHVYCPQRNPVTGNPTDLAACVASEQRTLANRAADRTQLGTTQQPGGPAWFVSEFGATSSPALLSALVASLGDQRVGWTYWAWRYYHDPTGSAAEGLVTGNGRLRPTARDLAETYPEAIAGRPLAMSFDPATAAFHLRYAPYRSVRAPTVVFVPTAIHYPHGYCARVRGGTIASPPGRELLVVDNARRGGDVSVSVTAGRCR